AWRFDGAAAGDAIGGAIAADGDVNGDDRPDLVIGDPRLDAAGRTDAGAAYVFYGGSIPAGADLAAPIPRGFQVAGGAPYDNAGAWVDETRDANGDNRDDLLVGAPHTDHIGRGDSGSAYLLYGFGTAQFDFPGGFDGTVGSGRTRSSAAPATIDSGATPATTRSTATTATTCSTAAPDPIACSAARATTCSREAITWTCWTAASATTAWTAARSPTSSTAARGTTSSRRAVATTRWWTARARTASTRGPATTRSTSATAG